MLPRWEGTDVVSGVTGISVVTGASVVTGVSVVTAVSVVVDVSVVIGALEVIETSINFEYVSKQTTPAAWLSESQLEDSKWLHLSKLDSCPEQITSL